MVLDIEHGRIFMHPDTGFTLSLMKHDRAHGEPFTELTTGLDHFGLTAASREALEEWARRFGALGVTYTPIRDMEFGYHLNFRDPDNIALELSAPNGQLLAAKTALAQGRTSHGRSCGHPRRRRPGWTGARTPYGTSSLRR